MTKTPGREYLDRRLELLIAGKFEEMVDTGYDDDAVLIDFNGPVRGRAALVEHFRAHLGALGGLELRSIDTFVETENCVMVELTVLTTAYGEVTSLEAFVLRDGRAGYHFTALK